LVREAAHAASHKARLSQTLPFRVFPDLRLPSALVIAGTNSSPRGQLRGGGKLLHVHADLGHEGNRDQLSHSRNRHPKLDSCFVGLASAAKFLFDNEDLPFQKFQVIHGSVAPAFDEN